MRRVNFTLNDAACEALRELTARYGPGSSASAVIRRAVSLLLERWEQTLDRQPRSAAAEVAEFASESLGAAQRVPSSFRREAGR